MATRLHRNRRHGRHAQDLRRAIDCLPPTTREAMLAGISAEQRIIVGAYTDREGGVCPMLAAHRRGGRTDLLAFAHAWDRFTGAGRSPRRASSRELRALIAHLEASLLQDTAPELDRAIREHRELLARHRHALRAALSEIDRPGEILVRRARHGARRCATAAARTERPAAPA
jgi:hypothetical protein